MPRLKMKLGQTSRQFQIIQRVFHNKILNTKTVDLTQGAFTAVQLAQDHVSRCVQQIELLQEVYQSTKLRWLDHIDSFLCLIHH